MCHFCINNINYLQNKVRKQTDTTGAIKNIKGWVFVWMGLCHDSFKYSSNILPYSENWQNKKRWYFSKPKKQNNSLLEINQKKIYIKNWKNQLVRQTKGIGFLVLKGKHEAIFCNRKHSRYANKSSKQATLQFRLQCP